MTRKYLFDKMQNQDLPSFDSKLDYLENFILSYENYTDDQLKDLKQKFSLLKAAFKKKWTEAYRRQETFLVKNEKWLQGTFEIPRVSQISVGRPFKPFEECSERSKRRKTQELRGVVDKTVLLHATQTSLYSSGKRTASKILENLTKSPKRAKKYQMGYTTLQQQVPRLSPLQALSIFVEADASRRQYEIFRSADKKRYPNYKVIQQAKKDCYPVKESYRVTESCAEVNLQDLLDHTTKRLTMYLEDVLVNLNEEECISLQLLSKWGADGSQQDQFKQKIQNDASDKYIFISSFVPLQLFCGTDNKKIIWQNPTPSSPRYCRPIRMRFTKETVDITNSEINYIEESIKSLKTSDVLQGEKHFIIKHTMMFTMIDAKVCNAVTSTSSTMRCYICGATSKQFNDLTIKYNVDEDALTFGLCVLHARIRFFESILHLSYKITIQKWQIRSASEKEIVKLKKEEIQAKFREQTGLIVDVPKAGYGTTNDGNTSRRFFANPKQAADITGVDFQLIYRLKVILEAISSGQKLDLQKFADYGLQTAKLYVKLYSWHPMTPTLHKILIHGATVIEKALLPIGLLSEEAAEARNKHFRQYRQNFTRKFSREACNMDVLNRLLLSSDPLITSIRPTQKKIRSVFSKEALDMMIPAEPYHSTSETETSESSAEETEEVFSDDEPWISSSS